MRRYDEYDLYKISLYLFSFFVSIQFKKRLAFQDLETEGNGTQSYHTLHQEWIGFLSA